MTAVRLGCWVTRAAVDGVHALAATGVDFAAIDCQHSALDEAAAAEALRTRPAGSMPVLVRVGRNDPGAIGRVADAGAAGVIVPLVDDARQARAAVAAVRYPPQGMRSYGPFGRAATETTDMYVMAETAPALDDIDDICATPGLTGVYAGPADLGLALGVRPEASFATEALDAPLGRIAAACARAGIVAGVHVLDGAQARRRIAQGFGLVTIGSDASLLERGVRHELAAAR